MIFTINGMVTVSKYHKIFLKLKLKLEH
jgi:hypothetical protein